MPPNMPPKSSTTIGPLARIRKESNPPWPPASKNLIQMAHDYAKLWWELWEYHDEARWILEGEVEAICDEIEQIQDIISREDILPEPIGKSEVMKKAEVHLAQDYQEALLMQKKMRAWTANCRTYLKNLIKERKALIAQIIHEGNSLERIGLDRWRYWYMGSFEKLGREETVFHLQLEEFVKCKGSATEYARIRQEEYGDGYEGDDYDSDNSSAELAVQRVTYLDQGLVPIIPYADEIKFDKKREIYHLVLEEVGAAAGKRRRLASE